MWIDQNEALRNVVLGVLVGFVVGTLITLGAVQWP